jgi:hypothetical protein
MLETIEPAQNADTRIFDIAVQQVETAAPK